MPRLLTPEQKQELLVQRLAFTSSAPSALDDRQVEFADSLSRIHGTIRVAREDSGLHYYMASPICLERDGRIELTKMHLAVNVDKYLKGKDRAAMCMKTGQSYRVSKLLRMPALVDRGIADAVAKVQMAETNQDYLEQDTAGNWIPKSPGKVVPIYELPTDHSAIYYLQSRGFDPNALWHQFRLSYCYEERNDIFYRRLLNGFKASPLGRIVFYIDQGGINRGWQARILDYVDGDIRYYFHPTANEWMAVEQKFEGKWHPLPSWENWDSAKYIIGHGAKRNQCLLGYDAAVASDARDSQGRRYCILNEGPLSAGRFGPPAVASMGKFFSEAQAEVLCNKFDRVIFITENDASGQEARKRVSARMHTHAEVTLDMPDLPLEFNDAGEMTYEQAAEFINQLSD